MKKRNITLVFCFWTFFLVTFMSVLDYHRYEEKIGTSAFHEIWMDETGETVVNATVITWFYRYQVYVWKRLIIDSNITWTSFEIFRSMNASQTIQHTIDFSEGSIYFHAGNYTITNTIYIDSYTRLIGHQMIGNRTRFVIQGAYPAFYINPNSSQISFSNCTIYDGVG